MLEGAGDPVFGDAPLTILSTVNPSYFPPVYESLSAATNQIQVWQAPVPLSTYLSASTDQLWEGPVSLDTYATSFSVTLPSTTPSYALTGTGSNGLAFSTQSLELGGTLAAGDTFDLDYNGNSYQVVWTSNVPTLTASIQTALNNLIPTNTPTVTAFGANIYNFTFSSTAVFAPLTFTTDATSVGLTVTSYQVLTFGGNLQDGEVFTLGYGSNVAPGDGGSTSFVWSSNVTTLTSNIQIAAESAVRRGGGHGVVDCLHWPHRHDDLRGHGYHGGEPAHRFRGHRRRGQHRPERIGPDPFRRRRRGHGLERTRAVRRQHLPRQHRCPPGRRAGLAKLPRPWAPLASPSSRPSPFPVRSLPHLPWASKASHSRSPTAASGRGK